MEDVNTTPEAPVTPEPGIQEVPTEQPEVVPGGQGDNIESPGIQEEDLLGGEEVLPEQPGETEPKEGEPEEAPAPQINNFEEFTAQFEGLEFNEGAKEQFEKYLELGVAPEIMKQFIEEDLAGRRSQAEAREEQAAATVTEKKQALERESKSLQENYPDAYKNRPQIKAFLNNQSKERQEALKSLTTSAEGIAILNELRGTGAQVTGTDNAYQVTGTAGSYSRQQILSDWNSTNTMPVAEKTARREAIRAKAQREGTDPSWVATFF